MKVNVDRIMLFATALLVLGVVPQTFAQTLVVGTCMGSSPYTTIQQAVNASSSGGTVEVCPGKYPEQVTIKQSLTLMGIANSTTGQDAAVVVSPAGGVKPNAYDFDNRSFPIAAQILVQGPFGVFPQVTIENLTVDGANNGLTGCGTDIVGILFQNSSGTVENAATRNQVLPAADAGCQDGEGIYVQTQNQYGFYSTVTVENSSVHDYQKNGITGNDVGTTMTITSNYVRGWGATPAIGQNGIQLCCGATGTITSNSVIDDVYTGPIYGAAGILLYDTLENSGVSVSSNKVGNTQLPVGIYTDEYATNQYGDGVTVTSNQIFGALDFDAIDVCTNGNTITSNKIANSWESAVHLDASCSGNSNDTGNNNSVTKNTLTESLCAGVLSDPGTSGNTVNTNTFFALPYTAATSTGSCTFPPESFRAETGHRPQPLDRRKKP